jgi:mono/diheme cytochrome c family protein
VPSVALHALAAGIWIGGLWPLAFALRRLDIGASVRVTLRFSRAAIGAVALLVAAGLMLSIIQLESVQALWETRYGLILLGKLAAVLLLLALAAVNKLRLTPALEARSHRAAVALRRSIGAEFALVVFVLFATAALGTTPPPRALTEQAQHHHGMQATAEADVAEGYQISVPADDYMAVIDVVPARAGNNSIAVHLSGAGDGAPYDALDVRMELSQESAGIEPLARPLERTGPGEYRIARAELPLSGTWSIRIDALITDFKKAIFEAGIAMQTRFSAASITRGSELFAEHCVACHGSEGRGDGPLAANLQVKPADLTADHLFDHSGYDLFAWISNGRAKGVMPGFAEAIDEDGRWSLIDFVHAHAAGLQPTGAAARPSQAPDFNIACADEGALWLSDLRGRVVHLVFADGATNGRLAELAQMSGSLRAAGAVSLIVKSRDAKPPQGLCVADSPDIAKAYAIAAGVPITELAGAEMLVDADGWFRERWLSGKERAVTSTALLDHIRTVRSNAVKMPVAQAHMHGH